MHHYFEVILKVGIEEIIIKHGCRVVQGDNLAPMLFIFVTQLVNEDILIALKEAITSTPSVKYSRSGKGSLRLHKEGD